jgi:flagellar protein FlaG
MSNVDTSFAASSNVTQITQIPAAKPIQKVDQVSKEIRAVSDKSGQVNAQMIDQKTRSTNEIEKVQESLREAIRTLNESADINPNRLKFSVDSVSNKVLVVVTDEVTGEVVRQVPAEAVLRVAHNIEAMKGVLFDKML